MIGTSDGQVFDDEYHQAATKYTQAPEPNRYALETDPRFETPLSPEHEAEYQQRFGPDASRDYDMRGWFQNHKIMPDSFPAPEDGGHFPDAFKKPNHPTFSDQSVYHGKGHLGKGFGDEGGIWEQQDDGSYNFTPGRTNLKHYSPQELRDYFDQYEKGNKLILPGSDSGEYKVAQTNKDIPRARIGDDWTDIYNNHHDPAEILKKLPKDKEMFWDEQGQFYWMRPIPKTKDKPEDLISEIAGKKFAQADTGVLSDASLETLGRDTYRRELRRSPADGTFRETNQWNNNWDGFTTPLRGHTEASLEAAHERLQGWLDFDGRTSEHSMDFKTKSGKEGVIEYGYNPRTKDIYIDWMGTKGEGDEQIKPHEFGVDKLKELFKDLAEKHPEAETITANRAGGARMKQGKPREVTRPIPRELWNNATVPSTANPMPGQQFGAPGQRLTDLY